MDIPQAPICISDDRNFQRGSNQEPLDKWIANDGHNQGLISALQLKEMNYNLPASQSNHNREHSTSSHRQRKLGTANASAEVLQEACRIILPTKSATWEAASSRA